MQLLLQVLVLYILGILHPFHISICEIEHDGESKTLQITSRLFQDDFELALVDEGNRSAFFRETPEDEAKEVLKQFFQKHLVVTVDTRKMDHRFLGYEIEDNVVWCYLEIEKVNSLREISVQYSVLVDTFDDQINLAHIRYQGDVKSLKFQKDQLTGTTAFTD